MAKQEDKKGKKASSKEAASESGTKKSFVKMAGYVPRLKTKYKKEIVTSLMKQFSFKTPMRAPYLKKIAINQGVGDAVSDRKIMDSALTEMTTITGQKPVATLAKKDISNFKLRKGVAVGVKVTLRADMMYEFLDRFIATALPRIRDFKGISKKGFDGRGNYTLGIQEQIIFPEIDIDKVNKVRGMDITFVTSARNNEEAMALLKEFGMPFKKEEDENPTGQDMSYISSVAKKD